MITVYTDRKYMKNHKLVLGVDSYFNGLIIEDTLKADDNYILNSIDGSKLAPNYGFVITPFGITDYAHISTGCKAALTCKRVRDSDIVVSVDECGSNALEFILNNFDDVNVYMSYPRSMPRSKFKLMMNGIEVYESSKKNKYWK